MVTFMLNTNVPVVHFYSAAWPNIPPPLTTGLARNIVHGDGASQTLFEWGISVRCLWNLSSLIYVYTLTDGICGIEVKVR